MARMAVLSDRDIRAAIESGQVVIRPYDAADLQPSSVDLHLDRRFRVFRNNRYAYIDVRAPQPDLTELLTIDHAREGSRVRSWPGWQSSPTATSAPRSNRARS